MSHSLTVLLLGDTHLGFDLPQNPRVARRRRGPDFFANFESIVEYALRIRPAFVVHGGDVFFRSRVGPVVVDRTYAGFRRLAGAGIPVYIVPGNHDRSRLPNALSLSHPQIRVFDASRTFTVEAGGVRVALGGFPFLRGDLRSRFPEALMASGLSRAAGDLRLLCLHQTIEGAKVGPNGYTFRRGRDVIRRSLLRGAADAVLAGHIHRAQVLEGDESGLPPVLYPGSIERTSFAEREETKGFFEVTFAPDQNGRWRCAAHRFSELPTRPMCDIQLPRDVAPGRVHAGLSARARTLPQDAVVRIGAADHPAPAVTAMLTASALRAIFPPTMNVQLSVNLRADLPRKQRQPSRVRARAGE